MRVGFLWSIHGSLYARMCVASINSLYTVYPGAKCIVFCSSDFEQELISKYSYGPVDVHVVKTSLSSYPSISFKNFSFAQNIEVVRNFDVDYLFVVDSDVLWHSFVIDKFEKLPSNFIWAQKISYFNQNIILRPLPLIPRRNIAARTLASALRTTPFEEVLDVIINAGLYGGPLNLMIQIFLNFNDLITKIEPQRVKLSESLLSFVLPSLCINVISDYKDVVLKVVGPFGKTNRYSLDWLGVEQLLSVYRSPRLRNTHAVLLNDEYPTGRQLATHYLSEQKPLFFLEASRRNLLPPDYA
jgi:hypothetical protein